MLPIYLSIEGLYSYQKKQEIDFTDLTEAGLFGIFGKVGSGKSTIIEAISFALYGDTERLNKQEKRTYNMLNLKSDAATIVFEFLNFEGRKFRCIAQWRRRKKFEETTSLERYAYEWKEGDWHPLESSDGSEMTHLTYPNFRRTIIIPQGQFKEFLELRGKDRSDMMKDIFHLNRFDLGPKVSVLQRKNNNELEQLKGALSGYESVSTDILESKQTELQSAQKALELVKRENESLENEVKKLTESKRIHGELQSKKAEVQTLLADQPRMLQLEQELHTYEQTNLAFRDILNNTHLLNKEKEKLTFKIEQLSAKKQDTLGRLEEQEREWELIAVDYRQLEVFKAQLEDYKQLLIIAQNKEHQALLKKRIADGKPHLAAVQKEEKALQAKLQSEESRLETLKNEKIDTNILLAMEAWYQNDDHIAESIAELDKQLAQWRVERQEIASEFEKDGVTLETWESTIHETEQRWQDELTTLQQQETQWNVQAKLAEFADNLENGQPCPLCGALEHPFPMTAHGAQTKTQDFSNKQQEISRQLRTLRERYQRFTHLSLRWKDKTAQLEQQEINLQQWYNRRDTHRAQFCWPSFSATDKTAFLTYKDENRVAEGQIKVVESTIKEVRTQISLAQNKIDKYKNSLSEFEQNLAVAEGVIRQSEAQLRVLQRRDFEKHTETTLSTKKQTIEQKIKHLEDSFTRLSESIQLLKTAFASVNAERVAAKEQFQQLYQQLSVKQAEISALLKEFGYSDIIQVQQILQKNMDIERSRKTLHDFHLALQIELAQIADLEQRVANDPYDEESYQEKRRLFSLKREELELQMRLTGALEKECMRLQVEFAKKEKLLDLYEKLNLRKSNLTTLENLFRGSGFVNYISSIHLQRLCEIANVRFHRLTKNSLSLAINENNEFEVVDFLHNGFRRSVKTLSGGQSFQASLCLALALAENIQSLNKADKNFFFIDEGFGTQDPESMNIVFETLQYLHRENRIVGVISHVEELKERIPRSITVINHLEYGSQIQSNF